MGPEPVKTPALAWIISPIRTDEMRRCAYDIALLDGATGPLADDVAQTAVIRLNEAAVRSVAVHAQLEGERWRSWTIDAAARVLQGFRRAEARQRRLDRQALEAGRYDTPTEEIEALTSALLLEELSVSLTPDQQTFVHLRYFMGMTMREIAREMHLAVADTTHLGWTAIRAIEGAILR